MPRITANRNKLSYNLGQFWSIYKIYDKILRLEVTRSMFERDRNKDKKASTMKNKKNIILILHNITHTQNECMHRLSNGSHVETRSRALPVNFGQTWQTNNKKSFCFVCLLSQREATNHIQSIFA